MEEIMKEFSIDHFQAGKFYKLKTQSFIVLDKRLISMNRWEDRHRAHTDKKIAVVQLYFVTNRKKDMRHVIRTMTETSFMCYLNKLCPADRRELNLS